MIPTPTQEAIPAFAVAPATDSLFSKALGSDFTRLHPMMQARLGISPSAQIACIGQGMMTRMHRGHWSKIPFLTLGTPAHISFPEQGEDIPFTIENYPYTDAQGRSALTFARTFFFPQKIRRFDAYMFWNTKRSCVSDYIGRKKKCITDLDMHVDDRGHLHIRSKRLDWIFGSSDWRIPAWPGGFAEVEEWYDPSQDRFHIQVSIAHPTLGFIYGYEGHFRVQFRAVTEVPAHVR